jgi:6-phosphogluconate dehydrogenase
MGENGYNGGNQMQIGLLGLGKMGRNIADKLIADNHKVVVWNRSQGILDTIRTEKSDAIIKGNLYITHSIDEMANELREPQILWSMLPAGEPTSTVLSQLKDTLKPGSIVIDGGNAHYTDTEQRAKDFAAKEIKYLGIGVSGGLFGLTNGYPLMVGGDKSAYEYITPLLDSLSKPYGKHTYFGPGGAGHFVKMVHNAVEYGMMQSLGEGFGVLAKSDYDLDMASVARNWQSGSIVASFLLDMAYSALSSDPSLSAYDGYINATGEAEWTIAKAKEEKVPIGVIEQSLEFRKKSQFDKATQETYAAKLVAALRHEFGGHEQKKPEEKTNS